MTCGQAGVNHGIRNDVKTYPQGKKKSLTYEKFSTDRGTE